jgi:hypothetical protein
MASVDELIRDYLRDVYGQLRDLPVQRRREIVDELAEHIAEVRAAGQVSSEVDARNLLDRLGTPGEIAAEARDRFGIKPVEAGARESWALVMLSIGSLVLPFAGWAVGVALLWGSEVWSRGEKWLGTLVAPGGLGGLYWLFELISVDCISTGRGERCTGEVSDLAYAVAATAFVATAVCVIYLAIRRNIRSNAAADHRTHSFA